MSLIDLIVLCLVVFNHDPGHFIEKHFLFLLIYILCSATIYAFLLIRNNK